MGLLNTLANAVSTLFGITSNLHQSKTNGLSTLGTPEAKTLPHFLTNNPMPNGRPWSRLNAKTNYYEEYPYTGVIRSYEWTVTRARLAPDGYEREVMLVNGAFPGPMIEANWGDTIQVTVHNKIENPVEGHAIHWHGFIMKDENWEDGAPGITMCPIAPGKSFTYQFQATLYGSSWYHSHYSGQYADGIMGPIVIYGPATAKYDIDIGPVFVGDWTHQDYFTITERMLAPNGSPLVFTDNNLINGKMNFDCDRSDPNPCTNNAGISKFRLKKGKTHRLRLTNVGSEGVQRVSLDEHTMTVIANDFVPVEPYETEVVTLGVGQRTDVLVRADHAAKTAFWLRSNLTSCSLARQPYAVAAVYYDRDTKEQPDSRPWDVRDPGTCTNDPVGVGVPYARLALPAPDLTMTMDVALYRNASQVALWKFDGEDARVNYNAPPLLLANLGNFSYPEKWNVKNVYRNESVRVIINNNTPAPHPMHMHGFNMYILAEGPGRWDGRIQADPSNPPRRDTYQVRGDGHLVVQFDAGENPGLWALHCHIAWHVAGGFSATFLTQPDLIEEFRIPNTVAQTCRDWADWTKTHIPEQIDSGL